MLKQLKLLRKCCLHRLVYKVSGLFPNLGSAMDTILILRWWWWGGGVGGRLGAFQHTVWNRASEQAIMYCISGIGRYSIKGVL